MAVGLGLGWIGYTLLYFGYCSIKGPGVGLLDLVIPARAAGVQIPSSSGSSAGGGGGGITSTTPSSHPPSNEPGAGAMYPAAEFG